MNEKGEVEISQEKVIGLAQNLFGDKVYGDISEQLKQAVEDIKKEHEKSPDPEKDELSALREKFSKPITNTLMKTARQQYGHALKKSTQKQLDRKLLETLLCAENMVIMPSVISNLKRNGTTWLPRHRKLEPL